MKQVISGFDNKEKKLWNQLWIPSIEEMSEKSPNAPISSCYNHVYQEFILRKWELKINPKSTNSLSMEEYNSLPNNYGPDLTAIPRTRYQNLKTQKSKIDSSKKHTPYMNFVRLWNKEHSNLEIDNKQRFTLIGKAWKALTKEEQMSYADRDND